MPKALLVDPDTVRARLTARFRARHRDWFDGNGHWPVRIALGVPSEAQARDRLAEVREWTERWRRWQGPGRLDWTERRWPRLGAQSIPRRLNLDTPADIAALADAADRWRRASARHDQLSARWPPLGSRLGKHFHVLADSSDDDYRRLVDMLDWLVRHPDSGLFERQLPVSGVDSKWLEGRMALILDLLTAIRRQSPGGNFHDVTGLRREPQRLRMRVLDQNLRRYVGGLADITAPVAQIARLELPARCVFIVENLRTGLAFGELPGAVAFMGLGYAVDTLDDVDWLKSLPCWYWGDLDTHGFAILSRLRQYLPAIRSLLMDETTLAAHLALAGEEDKPLGARHPDNLTSDEQALYRDLVQGRFGTRVRLEQERVDWRHAWRHIETAAAACDGS